MTAFHSSNDTIAAIATPSGRGGIGVIRVSGKNLLSLTELICGHLPKPRVATFTTFRDAKGQAIDQGLVLYFPAPHSFTGEDVLELHGHGGGAVMQLLLACCLEAGARLAEPGEFTKRAFLNNKIDLAQAESIADLIDASSAQAARSAMRSLSGEFSHEINCLVKAIIAVRMLVEASLDFPEEDIDFLKEANVLGKLDAIRLQLCKIFEQARQGLALREGLHVVLIGQPNVGKSSLLNRLAGEEVAIVTSIPGTTRDSLRTLVHLDGIPLHIIDTAGLRDTEDIVEKLGIEQTWKAIKGAGLALLVVDATHGIADSDRTILRDLPSTLPVITVFNKVDLVRDSLVESAGLAISAKTGQGIENLRGELLVAAGWDTQQEGVFLARERHLRALQEAEQHLIAANSKVALVELLAEDLRLAQQAVSRITGEFSADDLLGEIFSRFCIGK